MSEHPVGDVAFCESVSHVECFRPGHRRVSRTSPRSALAIPPERGENKYMYKKELLRDTDHTQRIEK
jgi:hypothetical protein